jgi:hypothetical protein
MKTLQNPTILELESTTKPRSKLAKRIAKHLQKSKKMPFTIWMIVGKMLSYALLLGTFGLTVAILIKPEYLTHILDRVLHHAETLGGWNYVLASGITLIESIPFLNMAVPGQTVVIVIAGYIAQFNFW